MGNNRAEAMGPRLAGE